MKKILFFVAFAAMAQLASAQWFFLWKGDYRVALNAGVNMSFYKVKFVGPLADKVIDDVNLAISPTVGIHSGMEKDINKKTAFGFYYDFQAYSTHWSVSFGEDNDNKTLYKVKSTTLNMMQGIYFAFDIKKMKRKKKMQALGGLGLYEDIRFKGKIAEEETGSGYTSALASVLSPSELALLATGYAPDNNSFDVPFSFDFGVNILGGVEYRFNENFFIEGRLVYMLPLIGSGSTLDEWSSDMGSSMASSSETDTKNTSKLNPYVAYQNDKINRIAFVGTIGFRF